MNLAHDIAEDPVGELQVDSHEGETAHEDQGGHHQVDQQDVGHSSQLLKPKKELIFRFELKLSKICNLT